MLQQEQGFVISSIRHNDKTSIMKVFTRTHGMTPFVFYLAKTGRNAGRNALQQALTQIEFQTDYIPSASLLHIRDAKNLNPYRNIPYSPVKGAICLFLSEFLTHALNGEGCNPRMYGFLENALQWLDAAQEKECANFHIAVMIGTANCLGIIPDKSGYRPGYVLDLREGCFCSQCPHTDFADPSISAVLAAMMDCRLEKVKDAPLNGQQRVMILRTLNSYFRLHVPAFPVLESIDVLESVFS